MVQITVSDVILLIQAVALFLTVVVMARSTSRTIRQMESELAELRNNVRNASHNFLFDRLFGLYRLYIEHPDELGRLWFQGTDKEVKQRYLAYMLLDILYLMHLEWTTLDEGLRKTWGIWASRLLATPVIREIYDSVKSEYARDFRTRLEEEGEKYAAASDRRAHSGR
jgi:hypothetical protein